MFASEKDEAINKMIISNLSVGFEAMFINADTETALDMAIAAARGDGWREWFPGVGDDGRPGVAMFRKAGA